MSDLHNLVHQIDAYLTGELSATERLRFEHRLQQDPLLRQEVALQSEIVSALRTQRHLQLKQRLQALPAPPPLWLRPWVAASGAALTAILAGALWFRHAPANPAVFVAPLLSSATDTIQAPTVVAATALYAAPDTAVAAAAPAPPAVPAAVRSSASVIRTLPRPSVPEPARTQTAVPRTGGDVATATPLAPVLPLTEGHSTLPLPRVVSDGTYAYHYTYHADKLTLYGDFGSTPYELLELVSEGRRQLYMYHGGAYYHLQAADRTPTRLSPIRDPRLRSRLAQLRAQ